MSQVKDFFANYLGTMILALFAILSFVFVVQARDAFGFMGWVFCFAVVVCAGQGNEPALNER